MSTPFDLRLELARGAFDRRDFTGAARALQDLVAESQREDVHGAVDLQLLLARAYFGSAQLGRAESLLRELVGQVPDEGYLHLLLGRTLERQGRAGDARAHLALAEVLGGFDRAEPGGRHTVGG